MKTEITSMDYEPRTGLFCMDTNNHLEIEMVKEDLIAIETAMKQGVPYVSGNCPTICITRVEDNVVIDVENMDGEDLPHKVDVFTFEQCFEIMKEARKYWKRMAKAADFA